MITAQREILSNHLFIDRRAIGALIPSIRAAMRGEEAVITPKEGHTYDLNASNITVDPWWEGMGTDRLPEGTVAVVPISGAITRYDDYWNGTAGTISIGKTLRLLDANPNVTAIVAQIDSGGGTIGGLEDLVDIISALKTPSAAFIDGMAASAAYWLAAAFPSVFAKSKLSEAGSIGVYVTLMDWMGYLESLGLRNEDVYSNLSAEKNETWREWLAGDSKPVADSLDPYAQHFIDFVASRREINTEAGDPFKGRLFMAEQAEAIGLIDGIASLSDVVAGLTANEIPAGGAAAAAVQTRNALSQQQQQKSAIPTPTDMKLKDFFSLFTPGKELTSENIEQANAALAEAGIQGFIVPTTDEAPTADALASLLEEGAEKLSALEARADAAEAQVEAITAALGDDAQAEGFDLMASVTTHVANSRAHTERIADGGAQGSQGAQRAQEDAAVDVVNPDEFAHNKEADAMGFGPKAKS